MRSGMQPDAVGQAGPGGARRASAVRVLSPPRGGARKAHGREGTRSAGSVGPGTAPRRAAEDRAEALPDEEVVRESRDAGTVIRGATASRQR